LEDTPTSHRRADHDNSLVKESIMSINRKRAQMTCRKCGKRTTYRRCGLCQTCMEQARDEAHEQAREQEREQQEREAGAARVA